MNHWTQLTLTRRAMATPTPSLIFCFRGLGEDGAPDADIDVQLGAVFDVDEPVLQPGASSEAQLTFWSDLARSGHRHRYALTQPLQ